MSIAENLKEITNKLPPNVKLIAISKNKSPEEIMKVYACGHRLFGENKVQEMISKANLLPGDIEWHMVGHLQSNKVKYIAPYIGMIHSVDSIKLLKVIDKEARKAGRVIPCLLQLYIAREETKFGMSFDETCALLESIAFKSMKHVGICGLMGMASFTGNMDQVRMEFQQLSDYFNTIRDKYFPDEPAFCEISMGMSDDFEVGIEAGSTMVRIGTALFGHRP